MGDDNRYATKEFWKDKAQSINDVFSSYKKHYDEDNYELAIYYINQCIKLSNELLSLSSQHSEHEYASKCITMLFRVFPDLYYNRALTYFEIGNLDMVEEYLNSDKIKKITYVQIIDLRRSLYLKNGRYLDAITYFNEQIVLLEKLHDHQEKEKPVMKGKKQDEHTVMYKITRAHLSSIHSERALFLTYLHKSNLSPNDIDDNNKPEPEQLYDNIPAKIVDDINSAVGYVTNLKVIDDFKYIKETYSDEKTQESLLAIYTCVYAIRMLHFSSCKELIHYTKIEHITSFFHPHVSTPTKEKKIVKHLKYRAYNSAYMNDPAEGELFRDILIAQLDKDSSPRDQFRSYWDELYGSSNDLPESKTYLLSFADVSTLDKLPMWSMYGDNSAGCCMRFDKKLLFLKKVKLELEHETYKIHNFMNHPDALSVSYCVRGDQMKDENLHLDLCNHILNLNDTIRDRNKELQDRKSAFTAELQANRKTNREIADIQTQHSEISAEEKELEKINPLVKIMLDQIRFLYKDKSYEHENELRIVRFADLSTGNVKLGNPKTVGGIPHLYVDVNTNISYKDVSILLGPKVADPQEISTYLNHVGVRDVKLSDIKLR